MIGGNGITDSPIFHNFRYDGNNEDIPGNGNTNREIYSNVIFIRIRRTRIFYSIIFSILCFSNFKIEKLKYILFKLYILQQVII